jgi:hypothetical protein
LIKGSNKNERNDLCHNNGFIVFQSFSRGTILIWLLL